MGCSANSMGGFCDAVISLSSLCFIEGNPPLGQERAWNVALKTSGHRHSLRGSAMGTSHTEELYGVQSRALLAV